MLPANQTKVRKFLLLGFRNPQNVNVVLSLLFLTIYIFTLLGNLLIIVLVANVQHLKKPMYFFITQLSLCDILLTTNTVPNMLRILINGGSTISFISCIAQLYFHGISIATECLLLMVMSYDRYLAICRPLHYTHVMDHKLQFQLVVLCWIESFLIVLPIVVLTMNLEFCGPKIIDHYFCDLVPVLALSCSDYTIVEVVDFALGVPTVLVPFFFILFTYLYIFTTTFGISSSSGLRKAFSTCSSHLIVVSTFYGTLTMVYLFPSKGQSSNHNKIMSLLYSVGAPFLNPIIYSLRNQEIKRTLLQYISKCSNRN